MNTYLAPAAGLLLVTAGAVAGTGPATAAAKVPARAAAAHSAAAAGGVSEIARYVGPIAPRYAGRGKRIEIGVTVALSGPESIYGDAMLNGAELAASQIKALGGPNFKIIAKDNQSGSAQAGVNAVKELAAAHVPLGIVNLVADYGAMLPGIKQYKMLTFDGGGGTSLFARGEPYFWGSRAITPDDPYPGVVKYLKRNMPQVKTVSLVGWDLGPTDKIIEADTKAQFAKAGIKLLGYEPVPIGAADYSTAIQSVRSQSPDLVLASVFGLDLGNFMKQYAASGIGKPVIGFDLTKQAAAEAGPALQNYMYAFDTFDASNPPNAWAKIFVSTYRASYRQDPTEYAANAYEDVFAYWDLVRRVLAKGGDPTSGVALQKAMLANPTFKSVYGASATGAGTLSFNLKTHSVASRPMGLYRYNARTGRATLLASFNLGGTHFTQP